MKLIYLYVFSFIIISCLQQKEIVRPRIELKVYDKQSKTALQNVNVTFERESGISLPIEKNIYSDQQGIIKIPKVEIMMGNHPKLPLLDNNIILTKEQYKKRAINYIDYFKMDENSNRNKIYISDSIFLERKN